MWDRIKPVTTPADDPVTIPEVKDHSRIDGVEQDAKIGQLIKASVAKVEGPNGLGIAVMSRQWELSMHGFPHQIVLPMGPVTAVDSIVYIDVAGDEQTLAAADYLADLDGEPAVIEPAYGKNWPATRAQRGAVTVTFTAGYAAAASVPDDLKAALLQTIAHLFENREPVNIGSSVSEIPDTARAIFEHYRVGRFG